MPSKAEIRSRALTCRKALSEREREEMSAAICRQILSLPEYRSANTVMTYLDFRDEVQTTELAQEILKAGKRLIIPLCNELDTNIVPCEISNLNEDIRTGYFGIREPDCDRLRSVDPKEIDLILVPGVAFDHQGNRIGFGKGYYDRFLSQIKVGTPTIGLAFSCQLVEDIVSEKHDIKMSHILTENGIIECQ